MSWNIGFDKVREAFANQFEPDGDHFIYRRYMKGAPVRVSAAERDEFIRAFDRFIRFGQWGIFVGTIALLLGVVAYSMQSDQDLSGGAAWLVLGIVLMAYMPVYYWAWNRPARQLRDRQPIGAPRSRAEMRARMFSKMTYSQLMQGAGMALVVPIIASRLGNLLVGWNRLWLVMAGLLLLLMAIQAFRKWRFDLANRQ